MVQKILLNKLVQISNAHLVTLILILFSGCGTVYIPQTLPEARGVGRSIGQEEVKVKIIPLTNSSLQKANKQPYIRRVIDASDLNKPAKLVSVKEAINQKLPKSVNVGAYKLGVGDELLITQMSQRLILDEDNEETSQTVDSRQLKIGDSGFVSILGIGRLPIAGLTQFEAEDEIYKRMVANQINPEFELTISKFVSQQVYITKYENSGGEAIFSMPFTNIPVFLHQVLKVAQPKTLKGQDSLIILKRAGQVYRMSYKAVLEGQIDKIRILAEDRIFIEPLPYRPEKAIIAGEVRQEKLIPISADRRQSLAEALYNDGGVMVKTQSDTSQVFVIREVNNVGIVGYHLDSSNPARLTIAAKFELRPNDIIYVAPQFITNYNRALVQIFSAYAITNDASLAIGD